MAVWENDENEEKLLLEFPEEVEEILQKVVEVYADTEDDAIEIVTEQYKNEEIVLDSDNFSDFKIKLNI